MTNREKITYLAGTLGKRVRNGKDELLSDPVLEVSVGTGPIAGRLLNAACIPAFLTYGKLVEALPLLDWRWISVGVIGLTVVAMSLAEYGAIQRRKYCTNSNTNAFNLALDNRVGAIACSRIWGFTNMLNPANPVELGMVTYLGVTGDWPTFLNFVATRNIVKTIYNSSGDVLIATCKLDPVYNGINNGKRRIGVIIERLRKQD